MQERLTNSIVFREQSVNSSLTFVTPPQCNSQFRDSDFLCQITTKMGIDSTLIS